MSASPGVATRADALPWTCPFCALLCDGYSVAPEGDGLALVGSDCPRARAGLAQFGGPPATLISAPPRIGAQAVGLDAAIDEAARRLAASKQPLFGGLATDVDGARALYPLACATGAILDHAAGEGLMHSLRALQDRGNFTTTLAEVRNRADLIVCIGSSPRERYPELWRRTGIGEALVEQREIVFLGAPVDPELETLPRTRARSIALQGTDLFDGVALLAALVNERPVAGAPELAALAAALRAARYAVLIVESSKLPREGALVMESLNAIVAALNRHTRAATLPLSGNDGLSAVNYTVAWLSGMPLRSRAGPLGLEQEPQRFGTDRLLAEGSVDALLWITSFGPEPAAPASALPTVVLGHPATKLPDGAVFIPVGTPGIASPGHLVRTDGSVTVPLMAVKPDALPTAAEVLRLLTERVKALKTA